LYVPQVGHTRCGRFGWPQFGQTFTFGAPIACVARRLSRRDFEVFRFGTAIGRRSIAMPGYVPVMNAAAGSIELTAEELADLDALGDASGDRYADMSAIDR
jgi:hypothetical protein